MGDLPTRDYLVTVCAECLTASCWHGEFMCERSRSAKTLDRKASDLRAANLENPDNFSPAKLLKVCRSVRWIGDEPVAETTEREREREEAK